MASAEIRSTPASMVSSTVACNNDSLIGSNAATNSAVFNISSILPEFIIVAMDKNKTLLSPAITTDSNPPWPKPKAKPSFQSPYCLIITAYTKYRPTSSKTPADNPPYNMYKNGCFVNLSVTTTECNNPSNNMANTK